MAGIYIHIPFCKQACHYCDFHFSTSLKNKDALLKAIISEIKIQQNYLNPTSSKTSEEINTVYFGGGTPSLLSQGELMAIFDALHQHFSIHKNAEITLETNPDDLGSDKIKALKSTPINRLSIGIQSFRNEDLQLMNRAHNAQEALKVVNLAQEAGFNNISIDLIYGIPTLSNTDWKQNLQTAFNLNVNHISAYCLTVEPKTALAYLVKEGKIKNVEEEKSAEQFDIMLEAMRKNTFEQYEISNFCKDNHYSKHNSNYWLKQNYLGLGPSAHSFNGESRQWNVSNNNKYIQGINAIAKEGMGKWFEIEKLNPAQRYNEYIMTSLRTIWGTNLDEIENNFGKITLTNTLKEANSYIQNGDLLLNDKKLTLSNKGKLIADRIASDLFYMD